MESSVNRFLKFVEETQNIPYFSTLYDIDMWEEDKKKIVKDLEMLDILKKYIYFSTKSGCIRMKDICKSSNNFDYEDLKEWLKDD